MEEDLLTRDPHLRYIGYVRSEVGDRKAMPAFGAPACVELVPEMAPALLRIEKHSHFWILAWLMGRPERDVLQVVPRGVDPDQPDAMHGVFAVRSPARPNPIGLTSAKLERVEGLRLYFDRLDFLDGTPVLDVKPYFAARDLIFNARNVHIGKPRTREDRRESLLFQALRFVPSLHPDVAVAVRIVELFGGDLHSMRVPMSRPYLVDALMGISRLSLSNGITLSEEPVLVLNGAEEYALPAYSSFEAALAAADTDFLVNP